MWGGYYASRSLWGKENPFIMDRAKCWNTKGLTTKSQSSLSSMCLGPCVHCLGNVSYWYLTSPPHQMFSGKTAHVEQWGWPKSERLLCCAFLRTAQLSQRALINMCSKGSIIPIRWGGQGRLRPGVESGLTSYICCLLRDVSFLIC